ncbi:MAG: tRNA (N(6)-L-threonylcarbamoyladenosine(37)-C(2))-methylthiotransferase MtaB [Candidatus Aminicenantes bacterium]|nr:tRNA (N(6)-L-threonylcarbamoyladenosine(37)-C(2))-methylthiotransferase MtaB [Candidatus Aminicenantes bacterium]MDH5383138.1 tRNA (N(6)-L-threonylcarbamoyladenosine(37)-C(2))-methylthiotransferase MtaB [Candidatus Aminicenantes bacterium]MDH5742447.1 tRNA (N(6)-L-threonylcarbamoyladenosine(37)-C(2))-methylthiotransferase MtaB [Candidatus Aminicenantes bacterium]
MISFSIQSFGCRVNQAEAFSWAYELQNRGLGYIEDFFRSDIVLINTCTLTSRADRDVRHFINRVRRLNPDGRLIVTGCFSERYREELEGNPNIWKVFLNEEKEHLSERIVSSLGPQNGKGNRPYRSRALVKIQDGCDFRCSFCVIPSVRGESKSLPREKVLSRVREFSQQGFKEIVLTGVHICSYGLEQNPESTLLDLLQDMEKVDGVGRLRLSSLDPRFLDLPLLDYLTSSKKVCPHFHLSLQHCSDEILHRMGRKIRVEDYQRILGFLRQRSPFVALGADIIVGFPGESDEDFKKMFCFLQDSPLTYFHVFSYSPRPGTTAAQWEQVDERVKKERASTLRDLSRKKNLSFRQSLLGQACEGVVIKKENGGAQVLTSNYIKVHLPSCSSEEKNEVWIRITEVSENLTKGKILI